MAARASPPEAIGDIDKAKQGKASNGCQEACGLAVLSRLGPAWPRFRLDCSWAAQGRGRRQLCARRATAGPPYSRKGVGLVVGLHSCHTWLVRATHSTKPRMYSRVLGTCTAPAEWRSALLALSAWAWSSSASRSAGQATWLNSARARERITRGAYSRQLPAARASQQQQPILQRALPSWCCYWRAGGAADTAQNRASTAQWTVRQQEALALRTRLVLHLGLATIPVPHLVACRQAPRVCSASGSQPVPVRSSRPALKRPSCFAAALGRQSATTLSCQAGPSPARVRPSVRLTPAQRATRYPPAPTGPWAARHGQSWRPAQARPAAGPRQARSQAAAHIS